MGFLNRITTYLNEASRKAISEDNDNLEKKLFTFLTHIVDANDNGTMRSEDVRELNEDIVYFVLNGTDVRNNERAFVAAINWAHVDNAVKSETLLSGTGLSETALLSHGTQTQIFSTKTEKLTTAERKLANRYWNLIWEDYIKITKEEDETNQRLTFNHWLLNYTANPLNTGIYWGNKGEEDKIDGGYFWIPPETLELLGISCKNGRPHETLQLSPYFNRTVNYDSQLSRLKAHMSKMAQRRPELNHLGNVAFSVYHIIRSYGCWGGNSFYSIPVGSLEGRSLIMSLCSQRPLNEQVIERWALVANKIFRDIMPQEINLHDAIKREMHFMNATYALGHNLKNRLLDAPSKVSNISLKLKRVFDNHKITEREKDEVISEVLNLQVQVQSLANTGNLLDLMARAMTEGSENVFSLKPAWHEKESINLRDLFVKICGKFATIKGDGKYPKINISTLSKDLFICTSPKTAIRPADFVFEEIFFELLINAAGYGKVYVKDEKNWVDIEVKNEGTRLMIINTSNAPISDEVKFQGKEEGKEIVISEIAQGGLLHIYWFLELTGIGSLSFMIDRTNNRFTAIITFTDLKKIP
jgi:hypothetical protein